MKSFDDLFERIESVPGLRRWLDTLPATLEEIFSRPDGHYTEWVKAIKALPDIHTSSFELNTETLKIGEPGDCDDTARAQLRKALLDLKPWRKGPFDVHGVFIDTEWRSDWKWQRVREHISSLQDRLILDVGCGSGYHCWRMAGEGARLTIGIDPSKLYHLQFLAIKKYIGDTVPAYHLPLALEDVTPNLNAFDTVFSMGVLYHRRSPFDHLAQLRGCLRKGGELVLETLIIDGKQGEVLVPADRYAKMKNVWFIPSAPTLIAWLQRIGFVDVRAVDRTPTTTGEQHQTPWASDESLADFLDPNDPTRTIEGYPGPVRCTFIAKRP